MLPVYQMLLTALWLLVSAHAQTDTLDAATFWDRLRQTDAALTQTIPQADHSAVEAQLTTLWQGVQHIRLADSVPDSVIDVDLQWLRQPLVKGDTAALRTLQQQVEALLAFHAREGTHDGASLSALTAILKDPRFQYDTAPSAVNNSLSLPNLPAGLSELVLGIAAMVVIAVVLSYIARNLRVQRAALIPLHDDDPVTSANALELAASRAAARDYRTAIRYLYLSSLLLLDERGLITYNATLTNREHLAQISGKPQLAAALRQVVDTFEDVWYGYAAVDAAFYNRYYQHIQQLQSFVK